MTKTVIALVDCNNFFVSCERLRKPELINKPVCVLSNNDGCVVSRSNEAKRMGVAMGSPYFIAKHQFKNVKFLSGDLSYYCDISMRIMEKLKTYTPDIEIYSIDEAFLNLTNLNKTFNCNYDVLINKIIDDIKNNIGIDVSIGLSYSKVLAKLASDKSKTLQKNKIDKKTYIIGYNQIQKELKETLISDVWGVGKNTYAHLKKYLIQTCYDYVSQEDLWIKKHFGKLGIELKQELLGNSINKVINIAKPPKSVSRSESFKEFQTDKNYIISELGNHIHKVCKKLRNEKLLTSCIEIMIRTKDFQVLSNKINLINPTNTEFELIDISKTIIDNLYQKNTVYRSVGFCAMKLTKEDTQQMSIFEGYETIKKQELSKSWDKLEEKFGKGIIKIGSI